MSETQDKRRNLLVKNPWHFVSYGQEAPRVVKAII
jgi:hypothetical protein